MRSQRHGPEAEPMSGWEKLTRTARVVRQGAISERHRLNFQPGSYPDGKGQLRPMHRMSAKGVSLCTPPSAPPDHGGAF